MPVSVKFMCGGCFAESEGARHVRRVFDGLNGKGYGFGSWREEKVSDVAPEGWIAFDPYTGCTYCPDCWAEIESTAREAGKEGGDGNAKR